MINITELEILEQLRIYSSVLFNIQMITVDGIEYRV